MKAARRAASGASQARPRRGDWIRESLGRDSYCAHRVTRVYHHARTAYQDCLIAELGALGRALFLDGEMQSAQADEFIYHEALMHPALLAHPRPRRALIMGGGEGASLREGLRHRTIERLVMADIDGEVVRLAAEHLPSWHAGAFDDPRARVLIEDAGLALRRAGAPYDVIVSDLPSPREGGPALRLYTREFYRRTLKPKLAPGGVFALQAGPAHPQQWRMHLVLHRTLKSVFRVVRPYYAYVPSFDVMWSFLLCSDDRRADPARLSRVGVDALIRRRGLGRRRFIDGAGFSRVFAAPPYLRAALTGERRVFTGTRPVLQRS